MPGSKRRRKKHNSRSGNAVDAAGNVQGEVTPSLPTSGQILGVLVRSLGISHPNLGDKTAQRYFSGHLGSRVKESSRDKIIAALSETLARFHMRSHSPSRKTRSVPIHRGSLRCSTGTPSTGTGSGPSSSHG